MSETLETLEPPSEKARVRAEIAAALPAGWGDVLALARTPDEAAVLHRGGQVLEHRLRVEGLMDRERRETRQVRELMRRLGPALRRIEEAVHA